MNKIQYLDLLIESFVNEVLSNLFSPEEHYGRTDRIAKKLSHQQDVLKKQVADLDTGIQDALHDPGLQKQYAMKRVRLNRALATSVERARRMGTLQNIFLRDRDAAKKTKDPVQATANVLKNTSFYHPYYK